MPELPEVELFKRYLDETSLHHKITKVEILHPKVLINSEEELNTTLVGQSFDSTIRWGKNLFIRTDGGQAAIMHFGMTGFLEYFHNTLNTPKYSRVVFQFDNDFRLAYVSRRMFGRLGLISSVDDYISQKSLAQDALEISLSDFQTNIQKRKKNIKAVLLDQGTAAGVGNWIADEILYQARIHPLSPSQSLNGESITLLYNQMQDIIKTAIAGESVRADLPPHYITKYGRNTTIACPKCKNDIEKTVVAGRGTYACSTCQKVY